MFFYEIFLRLNIVFHKLCNFFHLSLYKTTSPCKSPLVNIKTTDHIRTYLRMRGSDKKKLIKPQVMERAKLLGVELLEVVSYRL